MKTKYLWVFPIVFFLLACNSKQDAIVVFETSAGNIEMRLYKETSLHKELFVKLIEDGFFDGQLFYNVAHNAFIATGDPNSKSASRNRLLGNSAADVSIEQEIVYPQFFHKRGALSAVSHSASPNSPSQNDGTVFRIIVGDIYSAAALDSLDKDKYEKQFTYMLNKMVALKREQVAFAKDNPERLQALQKELLASVDSAMKTDSIARFTPEQRAAYSSIGGIPQLDNEFTVFGEVTQGQALIDSISRLPADQNGRPINDIRILKAKVITK